MPEFRAATLEVSPPRPALDSSLRIRVAGLAAGQPVRITARQPDSQGRAWESWAGFTAGPDGVVDLGEHAPTAGTYHRVDPMGLIWSMRPVDRPARDVTGPLAPVPLDLTLDVDGHRVDTVRVDRRRVPDGVRLEEVHERGLVGVLATPDGPGPWPGVLVLGGSEGGLHAGDAALLAGHGFAALALAYYGMPGLPPTAVDLPLEYFGTALGYLAEHRRVRADRLAVVGGSKGGEAALLVAATFPEVRAVVSVCGSGVVTQGIGQDVLTGSFLDILRTPVPNWTWQGKPLPFVPNRVTPELAARIAAGQPVRLLDAFTPGLTHPDLAAATIPIERTSAAVLLVSSSDDAGYGPAFHAVAAARLRRHPRPWRHVIHPGAGHNIIAPPFAPTTCSLSPGPGVTFDLGGTPEADATARTLAWTDTVEFLTRTLKHRAEVPGR